MKLIKKFFLVSPLVVFLSGILLTKVPAQVTAQGANPVWIDRAHINYNGDIYFDSNMYDDNFEYLGAAGGGCASRLKTYGRGGNTAEFTESRPSTITGGCADQPPGDVPVDGSDGMVNAFRISDDTIYFVQEFEEDPAFGGNLRSVGSGISAFYKKVPQNDAAYSELNQRFGDLSQYFFKVNDGGQYDLNRYIILSANRIYGDGTDDALVLKNGGAQVGLPQYAEGQEPPDQSGNNDATDEDASCEAKLSNALGWAVCGVLGFLDEGLTALRNVVISMLVIDANQYDDDSLRQAWSYFRNIASLLLVIIGLIMVIGQAVGKD